MYLSKQWKAFTKEDVLIFTISEVEAFHSHDIKPSVDEAFYGHHCSDSDVELRLQIVSLFLTSLKICLLDQHTKRKCMFFIYKEGHQKPLSLLAFPFYACPSSPCLGSPGSSSSSAWIPYCG